MAENYEGFSELISSSPPFSLNANINIRDNQTNFLDDVQTNTSEDTPVYSSEANTLSGRLPSNIWTYVTKDEKKSSGHYSATCRCKKFWSVGKPREIEAHIANHCPNATKDIRQYYLNLITSRTSILTEERKEKINKALIRTFIMCGIPFKVIDSPFMIELLKELRPAYSPSSRKILSGNLLDQEIAYINQKLDQQLENSKNLTLEEIMHLNTFNNENIVAITSQNIELQSDENTNYNPINLVTRFLENENIENNEQVLNDEITENIIDDNNITEYSNNEYEDQELNNEYEDQELDNEYEDQELDNEYEDQESDNDKSNNELDIEENNSQTIVKKNFTKKFKFRKQQSKNYKE
ncbi:3430_t:CDS:2 [Cetraspora pellucida]|uniref:3430_t:CDS:1 n=1 Tax=Cetraspora pellucida TaxID=1433469 RepID=A0A9N9NMY2_9GLOM|nr:3430_t:CDS:2 [Cetraspora pellucida]